MLEFATMEGMLTGSDRQRHWICKPSGVPHLASLVDALRRRSRSFLFLDLQLDLETVPTGAGRTAAGRPPPTDWQNMWHDPEQTRREKKSRKDSVPVLPPSGDGVEVAPQ